MNNVSVLGIDLAKDVFQLHGVNEHGKQVLGKRISRAALPNFIANLPSCKMEACGSANYWSRKFISYGHRVSQISPEHVKPFAQGNKMIRMMHPTLPDLRSDFFELNKEIRYLPTPGQKELEDVRTHIRQ